MTTKSETLCWNCHQGFMRPEGYCSNCQVDRPTALDAACRAFCLKEAENMGWTYGDAEARLGLYREEIAAAVVAALRTLAQEL